MSTQGKDYVGLVYSEERTRKTAYPGHLARHLAQRFGLRPGMRLLEVGCGRGDFLVAFQDLGLDCAAVDQSDHALRHGVRELRLCDVCAEPLPYPDASFDCVYSKSLVEHMWDARHLMAEILRVLRPGGLCITMTPDWASGMSVFYEDPTHCRPYTPEALRDLLLLCGFAEVRSELFVQHPWVWRSRAAALLADGLALCCPTRFMRRLTRATGVQFFRWSVERMVLATGRRPS